MMDYLSARMRKVLCPSATAGLACRRHCGGGCSCMSGSLAQQPVTVQIESGSGAVGDNVTARLSILDPRIPGLGAFTIDVHYGPAIIEPISPCAANPDHVPDLAAILQRRAHNTITVRVVGYQAYPDAVVGDVALADLTFTVLSNGTSALTPEVLLLANTPAEPID